MLRQVVQMSWTMLRQVVHLVGWTVKVLLKWSVQNKTTQLVQALAVELLRVQRECGPTLQWVSQVQYDDVPRFDLFDVRLGVSVFMGAWFIEGS
jgi:hypothetical protein